MNRFKLRVNSVILKAFSDKTNRAMSLDEKTGLPVPRNRRMSRMSIFTPSVPENSIQNAAFYTEQESSDSNTVKSSMFSWLNKVRKMPKTPPAEEEKTEEAVVEEEEVVEEEVVEEEEEE